MATVYQQNNSPYWSYRFSFNGKEYRKTTKTTKRAEAVRIMKDLIAELKGSSKPDELFQRLVDLLLELDKNERNRLKNDYISKLRSLSATQITLEQAWNMYIELPKKHSQSKRTIQDYESMWNKLKIWAKDNSIKYLHDIDDQTAIKFTTKLHKDKLSPRRYNLYLTFFTHLYKLLATPVGLTENPWQSIDRMELNTISKKPLSQDQLQKLFNTAKGEFLILFYLGCYTALRLGDCCQLKWSLIDFSDDCLTIMPSKTKKKGKEIIIPLNQHLLKILTDLKDNNNKSDYILPNLAEKYQTGRQNVVRSIQKTFRDAGIETQVKREETGRSQAVFGFHSFRHSFVTLLSNENIPRHVVMDMVGHSTTVVHQVYQHVETSQKKQAIKKLPKIV